MTRQRTSQLGLAVLVATLGVACASETDSPSSRLVRISATVEQTIEGAEEGPSVLSQVRNIAVDGFGRVYLADAGERMIKVFDANGEFLRTLGRAGEGPGEFNTTTGVAIGPDERTYVYDPQGRRVVVFDSSGTFVETRRINIASYGYFWEGGIDADGRLLDEQLLPSDSARPPRYTRRSDLQSGVIDTIAQPSCAEPRPGFAFGRGFMQVPFGAGQYIWIDAKGGGTWCADRARAAAYFTPFGESVPRDSFVTTGVPAPVLAEERAEQIALIDSFAARVGGGEVDYARIPEIKPLLLALDRDDRGWLWMTLVEADGTNMRVFSPDGREVARVDLPVTPIQGQRTVIRGERLYVVGVDEVDVPRVYVLRAAFPRVEE